MGRGRQKAKQRKVARNLKYSSPDTDYRALERELVSKGDEPADQSDEFETEYSGFEYEDPYADEDDEEEDVYPLGR
ncbi:DUF3073 domain-containing protein [Flaviflexus equikiangi]|uniref:DUF3073 domain-containing protein n=1 Tax=Flaviflexus equikiangi TaxID=2758573 RepID=A0ABS2TGX7_9ACTO|nr:DUF3073 domain-containing protein [Flaviflexus equikiangi]MBM9433905.1 DUF3073 domain-containing protein [Flaviflexus equikiangi]